MSPNPEAFLLFTTKEQAKKQESQSNLIILETYNPLKHDNFIAEANTLHKQGIGIFKGEEKQ